LSVSNTTEDKNEADEFKLLHKNATRNEEKQGATVSWQVTKRKKRNCLVSRLVAKTRFIKWKRFMKRTNKHNECLG